MLNGLERFCHFFVGVSTQSPLPSLCLEYGGLQCSHIFIIRCVFIVFIHGLFHFLVPFNVLFIFIYFPFFSFIFMYFHLFSFLLIYFHFCSFFFHILLFFSLEKTITNLNHLHVDPRLSSADINPNVSWFIHVYPNISANILVPDIKPTFGIHVYTRRSSWQHCTMSKIR